MILADFGRSNFALTIGNSSVKEVFNIRLEREIIHISY